LQAESDESPNVPCPERINLTKEQFNKMVSVWNIWRATGKVHLLSELMNEPDEPWHIVLEIDNNFNAMKGFLKEQEDG